MLAESRIIGKPLPVFYQYFETDSDCFEARISLFGTQNEGYTDHIFVRLPDIY